MKKRSTPPVIATKTLTRRSLLDWLGSATVLALGGELLSACVESGDDDDDIFGGADPDDAGQGSEPGCDAENAMSFEPGDKEGPILGTWPVRTVDPQSLTDILKKWKLRVDGLVENPVELSFAEMLALPRQDQVTDFHCVEGWSVLDVPWNGVHMKTLFDMARPLASATHVTFHTIGDRYNESLPIDVALEPRTMLAYGVDCATLPAEHGFPLRVVVPRLLGYKNAKYVYRLELDDKPMNGYWVAAGYPYDGDVPKDRLRSGKY